MASKDERLFVNSIFGHKNPSGTPLFNELAESRAEWFKIIDDEDAKRVTHRRF